MRTTSASKGKTIAGIVAAVALTIGVAACGSDDTTVDTVVPGDSVEVVDPAGTQAPVDTAVVVESAPVGT